MFSKVASVALIGLLCLDGLAARAEAPAPFPDFSARRVKPPAPGTRRRITVQIEPAAPVPAQEAQAPDTEPVDPDALRSPGNFPWFWAAVSPELEKAGPGRLEQALAVLGGSERISVPRLQDLQDIARDTSLPILRATVGTRVSPALVLAVIAVESGGRADAASSAGAEGLMQLMPATADRFEVEDSLEPEANIAGGVKYLDWLMREFGNDPILVLAGYNAGEGAVRDYLGVPPFAETRDYVPKVLAAFAVARGLCMTPPELISDGCVFVSAN